VKETRNYADFLRSLSRREVAQIYFFAGTDDFLKREALRKLLELILPHEARMLNFESFLGADCSWGDVETACVTSPLFSERRVVTLAGVEVMGETDLSGLLAYARNACKSTCLVLISSGQGEESRKRGAVSIHRLVSSLEGFSATYTFWQGNVRDARTWASEWLRENGKRMKDTLLKEVLETSGHSCYEVWNILEKAASLAGESEEITAEHVSLVGGAASVGSANCFRLAVATADRFTAHTHAAKCLDAGLQPTLLLWTLNRSFRDALRDSQGAGPDRSRWRERAAIEGLGRRFSEPEMCRAISFLYETERGIKKGLLEPRLAIELLINELTR
jgi:DNA polymerase III subunit delta